MNAHRALISAALLALVAAGCGNNGGATSAPASGAATSAPASGAATSTVTVVVTEAGCPPNPTSVKAGSVTFNATNQDAAAVSEVELKQGDVVVAERENLTPGLSASFTVQLTPGTYVVECPGATTDETDFTVTP